ncbi:MAG: ABC transporter substrate-binding protein [Bacteroidales bacterium]|nr:ABC transporter substrate-binding protein [Bacteroidales bacterium]
MNELKYASGPIVIETPVHVALEKGIFSSHGLEVFVELNPDGKTSLDRLFKDSVDIAAVMATPVVYNSFSRKDFRIIAKTEHGSFHSMVANKKSGIRKPSDLAGKKVGVTKGTSGEYFMNSFLISHNMLPSDLKLHYLKGPALVKSMKENRLDAIFSWEPYISYAERELKGNAISFPSPQLVQPSWLMVTMSSFLDGHPELITRFIKSLSKAIDFVNTNKQQSLDIHTNFVGIDREVAKSVLMDMRFNLSLDQELILDLENQARWLKRLDYAEEQPIPDYLELIHTGALNEVRPHQVTIIKTNTGL